jgi:hypothetical protein
MKNLSFRSRFFLNILIGILAGQLVYILLRLFEFPFRDAAVIITTSVVIVVLLGRMEKKYDEAQK